MRVNQLILMIQQTEKLRLHATLISLMREIF
jgi:hypothetical protein